MADRLKGRRRFTSFYSDSADDLSSLSSADPSYYCGIFEFHQGSAPRSVWESGRPIFADNDEFRFYIVASPAFILDASKVPPPTVIHGEYMGAFYLAYYIQIPDIQARGFSRSLVLCLANRISSLIDNFHKYNGQKLMTIAKRLQNSAMSLFSQELRVYCASLQTLLETDFPSKSLLTSHMEELQPFLRSAGIKEISKSDSRPSTPNDYLSINNDLRDPLLLTDFPQVATTLVGLITSLPLSDTLARVVLKSGERLCNRISFEGHYPMSLTHQLLLNCLFNLFCGRKLYIIGRELNWAEGVASLIASLSPFSELFSVSNEESSDIIILNSDTDKEPRFDVDNGKFFGSLCPQSSIVRKEVGENDIIAFLINDVKRIGEKFVVKMAEISIRSSISKERLLEMMRMSGFSYEDEPIIRNWSSHNGKTESVLKLSEEFWNESARDSISSFELNVL